MTPQVHHGCGTGHRRTGTKRHRTALTSRCSGQAAASRSPLGGQPPAMSCGSRRGRAHPRQMTGAGAVKPKLAVSAPLGWPRPTKHIPDVPTDRGAPQKHIRSQGVCHDGRIPILRADDRGPGAITGGVAWRSPGDGVIASPRDSSTAPSMPGAGLSVVVVMVLAISTGSGSERISR